MTFKKLICRQRKMYGDEERNGRMPEWVEGLIEESFIEGKKAGVAQENRRLHNRSKKATEGMFGSQRSEILESIF